MEKLLTLPPTPGQPGGTAAPTIHVLDSGFKHSLCLSYKPPGMHEFQSFHADENEMKI
jgi:hypothetical protein